ncbi:alpha/beta fold hydrolase [Gordonia sp. PP30]|uniref:PHA/PHB synthase family protein n=1 Tax=unclassified Gordonia (in: high G+C Gram-positive bacteria) TaxID=2657482 RepID=UPI001FFFE487|nr:MULTISPECIES: alpha/beta fold hydrolase [unclassified Gordonia (in: high G+C Gram-positive bacteria)]UQE73682.1 alpha/beta fold hydrolase [Gordonia sp. PP30]
MTIAQNQAAAGEIAAPLDLLLVNSTKSFTRRMIPDGAVARFGASLVKQPISVAEMGAGLAKEIGTIALGRSQRVPARSDKRFSDPAWSQNPLLRRLEQSYLATSDTLERLYAAADLDWKDAEKVRFVLDNIIEGLAPTNNVLLNPQGWKALIDTGGLSAYRGFRAFVRDMASKPRVPAMVEPDAFSVGETVAATKGTVVLRTKMFELIQYAPQTKQVSNIPLLMVPPVINKYYIMDIAPKRSMIEYYVQNGQQVFAISWRNPKARHRNWGFDAYGQAIIDAIDASQTITGADTTNVFGTCSGGILSAMVLAHLAATGQADKVGALTLAVTVLDQTQAGFTASLTSEHSAHAAIQQSSSKGYLDGRAMAEMFAWLRPTDLIWRYWVNNYIQGRTPPPFDVLFWNADTTRMTAALHKDMVLMGLGNDLVTPGAATMLGSPVDLGAIDCDSYVIGGVADHICPWQATYRSAALLGGKSNRYVLSTSGHIASLVNPPGNPKASFRTADVDAELDPDDWRDAAEKKPDSWWPDHLRWLTEHGGTIVDAPSALGAAGFEPLAPAPGTYVLEN